MSGIFFLLHPERQLLTKINVIDDMKKEVKLLKAVDFFCSGGGMSYGLTLAGIDVVAGIDFDKSCEETYLENIPNAKFIQEDIKKFRVYDLDKKVDIEKNDDNLIFVGCSPCQYWTNLNTIKKGSKKSKSLILEFLRFVKYYKPGYVIVENVPGILSRSKESGYDKFKEKLIEMGYQVEDKVVNLNDYGVPQRRRRFSLIASRVEENIVFPEPVRENKLVVRDVIGRKNGFAPIESGAKNVSNPLHCSASLSNKNLERIARTTKDGGSRSDWADTHLQLETYKKHGAKSFSDTYGRLFWDKPAPTITTRFYSLSNGRFGHPVENRALSLSEGAALQTFPKEYQFKTKKMSDTARIIGNAVPPEYARRIGLSIIGAK